MLLSPFFSLYDLDTFLWPFKYNCSTGSVLGLFFILTVYIYWSLSSRSPLRMISELLPKKKGQKIKSKIKIISYPNLLLFPCSLLHGDGRNLHDSTVHLGQYWPFFHGESAQSCSCLNWNQVLLDPPAHSSCPEEPRAQTSFSTSLTFRPHSQRTIPNVWKSSG